jgi:hypothetical protein
VLLVITYQAGKLVMVRNEGNRLNTHYRTFQSPMGLTLAGGEGTAGGNAGNAFGGGIYVGNGGVATVSGSTISGNQVEGDEGFGVGRGGQRSRGRHLCRQRPGGGDRTSGCYSHPYEMTTYERAIVTVTFFRFRENRGHLTSN